MSENTEILKMRLLISLLTNSEENCTVTGLAHTLNEPVYTVSRMLTALEKGGLVGRSDNRKLFLTAAGEQKSSQWHERVEIVSSHLLHSGMDPMNAQSDACRIAMNCSDALFRTLKVGGVLSWLKERLSGTERLNGKQLSGMLVDGNYPLPFLIMRAENDADRRISMANRAFRHPCDLSVKNGVGTLWLHCIPMEVRREGEWYSGKAQEVRYFEYGNYVTAELSGGIVSIPMSAVEIINQNEGLLYGTVRLRFRCENVCAMPESEALLTVYI